MRVLIAPQEFKGSLTAVQAADRFRAGLIAAVADVEPDLAPMADGGPGTVDAIVRSARGRTSIARVDGPLGAPVDARWGRIDDGRTAVIEMAAAAGLTLLASNQLDPRRATTWGVGQLILHALDAGVDRILIGVGGSATNDGGAGAAAALGARFFDDHDRPLPPGGGALSRLARIDPSDLDPRLRDVPITVLCDVDNPLLGVEGASAVYGPQKGADPAAVRELDAALANYAGIIERDLSISVADTPGAGAAGGLAAGLIAFGGARLARGFSTVADAVGLESRIAQADLVLTGEGRLDSQSGYGKVVAGVAELAQRHDVPCLAAAGLVLGEPRLPGLTDWEQSAPHDMPLAEAMAKSDELVAAAVERLVGRWSSDLT